ncbi:MAG: hypothetical protein A2760_00775 [Candidatus Doudnabacteria bacterium RIFCSPHIGHO2_01_FULL_50_67]|uniref:Uncharacterized protein n=1 Tax=Candidatus Doudnabacteria bacterium RIFCSPHIGHO2_12_FULL_48_16 TaxID=1817838 RepID=A0A1F5PJN4_9BACT|nr:MAG: hypothetical protein A3B77_02800 [Candidatus Doudnabacteria bacterium RIFCSPHIGHO2_02_FULL_49_24]OGE90077.1 MAG: hypothetical protein A3E29_03135 [Candidatus Doudnabacteria bacterium RIFCSPHIGHO2_12_FULL_48_16]OGE90445.1 MAG: hypothetical protein A2760_00775 [Candidatus Doudnabacteria bacterium RIFCSPHIGHO2_01_FULL_50_67]OGE96501.1 MAG: hypothetical protein A2990_04520 [Candidatus Doudnabacteria bacterium RIFCSPLOWO2_01_FULL_49_40]
MNWRIVVRTNDLNRYVDSYKEHWQKAIKAVGTLPIGPSCEAVNGWIRALRGFAEKIHDECINILNHGGKITSRENPADVWDRQRVVCTGQQSVTWRHAGFGISIRHASYFSNACLTTVTPAILHPHLILINLII